MVTQQNTAAQHENDCAEVSWLSTSTASCGAVLEPNDDDRSSIARSLIDPVASWENEDEEDEDDDFFDDDEDVDDDEDFDDDLFDDDDEEDLDEDFDDDV